MRGHVALLAPLVGRRAWFWELVGVMAQFLGLRVSESQQEYTLKVITPNIMPYILYRETALRSFAARWTRTPVNF